MKSRISARKGYQIAILVFLATIALMTSGCGGGDNTYASASQAECKFIVGTGGKDSDSKIQKIVWPGQRESYKSSKAEEKTVPCNPRNFIINPEGEKNANGELVGDRHIPSFGQTKDGTRVKVWSRQYWTLNQTEEALRLFYPLCAKYNCFSESSEGSVNFSTPGWNGMLSENNSFAHDQAAEAAVAEVGDAIWKNPTRDMKVQMALRMAEVYKEAIRAKTGYNVDLFCGSGNSRWPDPDNPGDGQFECTNVRFEVQAVEPVSKQLEETADVKTQAEQEEESNTARLKAAKAVYGDSAGYWLGLQDTLRLCGSDVNKTRCTVNLRADAAGVAGK